MKLILSIAAASIVGGCATAQSAPVDGPPSGAVCSNETLDRFNGRTATSEVAAQMLRATGAETIRWVQPGMAVTMDYREGRLTVHLDEQNRITRASCG